MALCHMKGLGVHAEKKKKKGGQAFLPSTLHGAKAHSLSIQYMQHIQ